MNLSRIKYDPTSMTPSGFYHQYRSHIINHMSQAGDTILWNNGQVLAQDEVIGAAFEDHILYCVIDLIDHRLVEHVLSHYKLKLRPGQRLMDVRADIFANVPNFLKELDGQLNAIQPQSQSPQLSSIAQHSQGKPANRSSISSASQSSAPATKNQSSMSTDVTDLLSTDSNIKTAL